MQAKQSLGHLSRENIGKALNVDFALTSVRRPNKIGGTLALAMMILFGGLTLASAQGGGSPGGGGGRGSACSQGDYCGR